jgi:hypothetical protein
VVEMMVGRYDGTDLLIWHQGIGRQKDLFGICVKHRAVAGICVGWPAQAGEITPRLSAMI